MIIETPDDIAHWVGELNKFQLPTKSQQVWLHPEWSKRNDPAVLKAIVDWVKEHGWPYRAGYQMHKLYRADANDNRTQPLAPLGGNPKLGY